MKEPLIIILLPLILANSLHMAVVKHNLLPSLQIPVSARLFGANKTLRAFLVLPLLNGAILSALAVYFEFLLYRNTFSLGMLLGLSYLLFELPNSFLKRKMGIGPGESAFKNKLLFTMLDKTDSAFGVTLTYFLVSDMLLWQAAILFLACSLSHFAFSWVLLQVKLKKSF